jgi:hypothetical protein
MFVHCLVVCFVLMIHCSRGRASLLVPIDLETQLNVSLFANASSSAATACCARQCVSSTEQARAFSVASPHGWNVTRVAVMLRGALSAARNELALSLNSVQLIAPGTATNVTRPVHDATCTACPTAALVRRNDSFSLDFFVFRYFFFDSFPLF